MPRRHAALERSNDHPDPGMRPVLDTLRSKLRGLPSLQDPAAVEWLIKDLAWFNYVQKAKSLPPLERLIASFHLYASHASIGADHEKAPKSVTTEDASNSESLGQGPGFTIPGIEGVFRWIGRGEPPDMDRAVEILAKVVVDDPDNAVRRSPDLEDKALMKRVREIIWEHTLAEGDPNCDCGEKFDISEDWAKHVRQLIWKELKDASRN